MAAPWVGRSPSEVAAASAATAGGPGASPGHGGYGAGASRPPSLSASSPLRATAAAGATAGAAPPAVQRQVSFSNATPTSSTPKGTPANGTSGGSGESSRALMDDRPQPTSIPTVKDLLYGPTLGKGRFSQVVYAMHKGTPCDYAAKIINKSALRHSHQVTCALNERDMLKIMRHPLIIRLYFTLQDDSRIVFLLELCHRGSLSQVIVTHATAQQQLGAELVGCNLRVARYYTAQLVSAVEYMHCKQRVVHGNIRPKNVLISLDGTIRLADFRCATKLDDANSADPSVVVAIVGNPSFISPEVLRGCPLSPAADMWAIGCVMYHLLTGISPFASQHRYYTMQRILNFPGSYFLTFPPHIDKPTQDLILSLLNPNPTARFASAGTPEAFAALKAHPFFEDFDTVVNGPAPFMPDLMTMDRLVEWDDLHAATTPDHKSDEATDQVPLAADSRLTAAAAPSSAFNLAAQLSTGQSFKAVAPRWEPHLQADEGVVYSGMIMKRVGLGTKRRELVLTDGPRLLYFDPSNNELKGTIPWSNAIRVEVKDKSTFYIKTPGRVYNLSDQSGNASEWQQHIHTLLGLPV